MSTHSKKLLISPPNSKPIKCHSVVIEIFVCGFVKTSKKNMVLRQLWHNLKHDGVIEEEEELRALELYENILKQTV